jgi:hypothetical protein
MFKASMMPEKISSKIKEQQAKFRMSEIVQLLFSR